MDATTRDLLTETPELTIAARSGYRGTFALTVMYALAELLTYGEPVTVRIDRFVGTPLAGLVTDINRDYCTFTLAYPGGATVTIDVDETVEALHVL